MTGLVDLLMPALGQSVAEGTLTAWLKAPGASFAADESLVSIQTDKAETEIPAPIAGVIAEVLVREGETVPVGTVLARLRDSGVTTAVTQAGGVAAPRAVVAPTAATTSAKRIPARSGASFLSPAVRHRARQQGLSAEQVLAIAGSGRGGRVTHADLESWLARSPATALSDIEILPMTGLRLMIAEHMLHAKRSAAHVNTVAEADMSLIVAARTRHQEAFRARHGHSLSYNAFLLKASATALAEFPQVNAILDERGIVMHRRVHLGMAVALEPSGLVVPVLRDAQAKSVRDIAVESQRLSELARARKLSPDDFAGGTCTVTNPGVFGNLFGTPILHVPQVAIVDFGAIKKRVVAVEGDAIAVRPMAYVVVAWDHRAMDGATAARFLQRLVKVLESFPPDEIDLP